VCHTTRSVQYQKARGYHAKVVECVNPFTRARQDLFEADVLALKPGEPVLAVQATTGANHAARREKLATAGFFGRLHQTTRLMTDSAPRWTSLS